MKCTEHKINFKIYELHMKLINPFTLVTHTSRWPIILQSDVTPYMLKTPRILISASSSGMFYLNFNKFCNMYVVTQYEKFNFVTSSIIQF